MEDVTDKIIEEVKTLSQMTAVEGGFSDIVSLQAVYFGDPGLVPVSMYPCVTVEPEDEDTDEETTGYDKRTLRVSVSVHIDAREYFEASEEEASGDRQLVQATSAIGAWFRRRSKRTLDGMAGVHNLSVESVAYRVQARGPVITKTSRTTLVINRSYARVLD